jgi:peptidyl-prolyl cis-trans isomerase SurA
MVPPKLQKPRPPSLPRLSPSRRLAAGAGALLLLATAMVLAAPGRAQAQDVQRIAAIVNDEVISRFDVEQRVGLVISTSRLADTAETRRRLRRQILRGLIDESLQMQAARRHSIRIGKADLKRAYRFIEQQNKLPAGGLNRYLQARRIPRSALEAQLRAEISWTKLVRRRLGRNVQIGDEEIDVVLARLRANAGRSEQNISEIFLPVDTPEQDEEVRQAAVDLVAQLRQGATFAALARQFSRGATAVQGGVVGWVQPGQLAATLDRAIADLKAGGLSEPIRAAGGYYIIRLQKRRRIAAAAKAGVKMHLKQIVLAAAKDGGKDDFEARKELARVAMENTENCAEVEAVAAALPGATANDLGSVALADLPPNIAAAVKDLPIGRFSPPIRKQAAVIILMVCKREAIQGKGFNRQSVSNNIARRRLAMLAQRYLRDLRRSAVVELR